MANEWIQYRLNESPVEIIDGDRGSNYPRQDDFAAQGDCLFLNAGNVTANGFNFSNCAFISHEKDASLRKGKLQRHDVVLTTRGTVGNVAYFDESVPYENVRINSGMVILRAEPDALLPRFLYLCLRAPSFSEQVGSLRTGSAQPQLPIRDINRIRIPVPPLREQHRITEILGAFDDKIELNRRTNETLESLARALFKSWFIDFDPVHAKAAGHHPLNLNPTTAALFPAEFQTSELGDIPKGWQASKLGDVAINQRRAVEALAIDRSSAYIGLEHMPRRSISLCDWSTAEAIESNKSSFKQNEILFGKLRPYFHKVGVAPIDGVCSTDILVITPRTPEWFGFVLAHCSSDALVAHTDAMSTGTKMPRANWKDIAGYSVVLPKEVVAAEFNKIVKPMIARIVSNIHKSRTLTALRDALLPRLLNGRII